MKVIGHRGWPTRYPDNVMEGIAAAFDVADMVEVDIRASGDGELVLSHDPVLGGLRVAESSWRALAEVELGGGFHPIRLEDLLEAFPTSPFNLEVKNSPGEPGFDPDHHIARRVAAVARSGDLLSCFHWPTMDAVRLEYPEVATGLLADAGWDVAGGSVAGGNVAGGNVAGAVDHALATGHVAVIPQWELALKSGAACQVAEAAGLTVAVWTLNDPSRLDELASIGVTAIITDDPGEMRRVIG